MRDGGPRHEGAAGPPPPLVFLAFLLIGLAANLFYPLPFSSIESVALLLLGFGITIVGLIVGGFGLQAMRRAGVSPLPWKVPGRLVTRGPFRYSRNPLYVSLGIVYVGISVALNVLWPLFLLVFALVIVDRSVIRREETFLENRFGEEYRSYKLKVRRWI